MSNLASINKEWVGLTLAISIMAAAIAWFNSCAAVKPVAQTAHTFADVCVQVAQATGDATLEGQCRVAADITELLSIRRQKDAGQDADAAR